MEQHRLSQLNTDALAAVCQVCGPVKVRKSGKKNGKLRFMCETKVRERIRAQELVRRQKPPRDRSKRYPARRAAAERLDAMQCERCPFVAEDLCQLDVDHIVRRVDGGTDDPTNLIVLCANCHRLKTRRERQPGWNFSEFMARSV